MIRLSFLGAAGTVTGSKYLIDTPEHRFMVDCGLFQGTKELRQRNWQELPVDPASLENLVLTHAHIDHTGYLPRLGRDGFRGRVLCTHGTRDLTELLLRDSAHLQEEEASFMNRKRVTRHHPALPLYSILDADYVVRRLDGLPYHQSFPVVAGVSGRFFDAGHILGSAWLELTFAEGLRLVFSGDLGRTDAPILKDPEPPQQADFLVLESTYGNRTHTAGSIEERLAGVVGRLLQKKGVLVIPAFAVERTQDILYLLGELHRQREIPGIPVFIDSPMAVQATRLFRKYPEYYDQEARALEEMGQRVLDYPALRLCETVSESKAVALARPPFIVIAASGMATGGRILHHLRRYLPDPRNIVLLVGYQSVGTRGWRLQQGEKRLKIFGEMVPVRAAVEKLEGFSGHADCSQVEAWTQGLAQAPHCTFMTHGDPEALEAQRARFADKSWNVQVPVHGEEVVLER